MYTIKSLSGIEREITVPADKSISHRAVMISAIAKGSTVIKPFLDSDDTRATLECIKQLGIKAERRGEGLIVEGGGKYFPHPANELARLNASESGTTMRILSGLLCTQKFSVEFKAEPSLSRRPMGRIVLPLQKMGADINGLKCVDKTGTEEKIYPPLMIKPVDGLKADTFRLALASAQVKSALLLAALYAKGETVIVEPHQSRDHTERMLHLFGADIKSDERGIVCRSSIELVSPGELFVPGDFSSAAFFIVLGLITRGSLFLIKNVNINPSRCGLLKVLERMGASISIENKHVGYEPYADILVKSSELRATVIEPGEIPLMIDEIPILCVAASFARGVTEIKGVKELRVKETDRITSMSSNLSRAGVDITDAEENDDCKIMIKGIGKYKPASFISYGDHRTAMSMAVFAAALEGQSGIDDIDCINKSFPNFSAMLESLY